MCDSIELLLRQPNTNHYPDSQVFYTHPKNNNNNSFLRTVPSASKSNFVIHSNGTHQRTLPIEKTFLNKTYGWNANIENPTQTN